MKIYPMITDTARSREPVSIVRTVAMGIQIKQLGVNNVAKDITTRSSQILTNTSRANSMSREGRPMMTCGDMSSVLSLCIKCFTDCERWTSEIEALDE